ncbi:FIG00720420: hypothetical protein [invertebrate metagenome]|uniref:DUF3576 domain-containing protein n=1 Tax=invertebrate metagenome TaxID=1711999 RepID=A0A484H8Q7_9ZZZZ
MRGPLKEQPLRQSEKRVRVPEFLVTLVAMLFLFIACAYIETSYPEKIYKNESAVFRAPGEEPPKDSGLSSGFTLFGSPRKRSQEYIGVGVNSFLWRAALDTTAFMPMSFVDPFGGVIITDWYASPENPQERFKMNIYILSQELRSDGLRVAAFRQILQPDGEWRSASLHADTEIENAILTRARQLKMTATQYIQ